MPRIIKSATRLAQAGAAEYLEPRANEGTDVALARSIADLSDKLATLGREQLDAVMDAAKQMSLTSQLIAKMVQDQDARKWRFRITERDADKCISELVAEKIE